MSKTLKHLTLSLFLLIAVLVVAAPAVHAQKRKAAVQDAEESTKFWTASSKKLKFKPANGTTLKDCFVYLPYHYLFELGGQKYRVAGGCWYVDGDGYLATLSSPKIITAKYYIVSKSTGDASLKSNSLTVYVSNKTCAPYYNFEYSNGKTEKYDTPSSMKTRTEKGGEVVYLVNAPLSLNSTLTNGFSTDKKLYEGTKKSGGKPYNGYILKNGVMKVVSGGKIGNRYTGAKATSYFDYAKNKYVTGPAYLYKNGKKFTGWNVTDNSCAHGYYTNGKIDTSVKNWHKHKKKWYYLIKGEIYQNKNGKKGVSKKALKTTGLNYFGHHAAPKGLKYNYYLNKDGSLNTNVFKTDKSWFKKNVRIMVNLKAGVDNVTFMGAYKGKYCVPLKTVVTTCSGNGAMRAKLVRGFHGRGWWGLGRTGRSRKRDFIYQNRFYYRNAVAILYSGALFHSARYLKHNNDHSLYPPHFNAMGKRNITTKCVRLQLENTLIVWRLSKQAKKASIKFVSKSLSDKNCWLPFGNTELSDSTGVKYWKKHYDPSGKF